MKKSELKREPYEVPRLDCLFAEVEKGFVGSPDGSAGDGGYVELGDETGDWTSDPTTGSSYDDFNYPN